jgi:putative tryptophan/tyrosine transport system permease protein
MMFSLDPLLIGLQMGLTLAGAAIALGIAFRLLDFPDLSPEGSVAIGAAAFAVGVVKLGAPQPVAFGLALLAGSATGALTALLHVRLHLNKFLAGILVIGITYSVSLRIMGGPNIGLLGDPAGFALADPAATRLRDLVSVGVLAGEVAILTLALILALSSRPGLRLRLAGSNSEFAQSLGIPVSRNLVFGLAATNGLAGVSGAMLASTQGFADVGVGQGMLIIALASVGIGARLVTDTRLPLHASVVIGAVVGSILYQVLVAYAVRLGLPAIDLKLVTAVFVLFMVARPRSKGTALFPEAVQ